MNIFDQDRWTEIWVTITRNKTRSMLTGFGVFWGILMLVMLLGAGTGFKNAMSKQTAGFSTNSLFFFTDRTSEAYKGFNKGRSWQMKNRDVETIYRDVSGVNAISPVVFGGSGDNNVAYGELSDSYNVKGVTPTFTKMESQVLIGGRFLNDIDMTERRKVCLIGAKIHEVLFKNGDALGKYVRVNGIYYQIVGIVDQRSDNVNINGRTDESVFIPFSVLQQLTDGGENVHLISVLVDEGADVERVQEDISQILKRQNSISPTDPQAVMCINVAKQFSIFAMLFLGIDALVWLVGIGTLLAGIIGISNIMMVTVRERTREIGVRRALGAKPFDIISQVMSESLILTVIFGVAGLTVGVFALDFANDILIAMQDDNPPLVDPSVDIQTAIAATVVIIMGGFFAGLIPAWRAMQIKAIDAIRDE